MKKVIMMLLVISILSITANAVNVFGTLPKYFIAIDNAAGTSKALACPDVLPYQHGGYQIADGSKVLIGKYIEVLQPGIFEISIVLYGRNFDDQQSGTISHVNADLYLIDDIPFYDLSGWITSASRPSAGSLMIDSNKLHTSDGYYWYGYLTKLNSQSMQLDILFTIPQDIIDTDVLSHYIAFGFTNNNSLLNGTQNFTLNQFRYNPYDQYDLNQKFDEIIDAINNAASSGGLDERAVHDAVLSALQDHDTADQISGNESVNDLKDIISGAVDQYVTPLNQLKNTLSSCRDIFNSSSTSMLMTFPAAEDPISGLQMWEEKQYDFSDIFDVIPDTIMQLVKVCLSISLYYAAVTKIIEFVKWCFMSDKTDINWRSLL